MRNKLTFDVLSRVTDWTDSLTLFPYSNQGIMMVSESFYPSELDSS